MLAFDIIAPKIGAFKVQGQELVCIDLGSNTLRVALFDLDDKILLKNSFEYIVGSARGLNETKNISNEAICDIKNSLKSTLKRLNLKSFEQINCVAVATAAFRKAGNTKEIFNDIFLEFGLKFILIDPMSEARLSYLGVQAAVKNMGMSEAKMAFVDLGGASIEVGIDGEFKSFDSGIITYYEKCQKDICVVRACVDLDMDNIRKYLNSLAPNLIALTSGIPTTIAALKLNKTWDSYESRDVNGYEISNEDFLDMQKQIEKMSENLSDELLGKGRRMLVLTGLNLLGAILKDVKAKMIVIDDGLREGLAVAYFEDKLNNIIKEKK